MNALILTLFVSLMLLLMGLLFFIYNYFRADHHRYEQTSLLPLKDEDKGVNNHGNS